MFKYFFDFVASFFPYKTKGNNNKIYIVEQGVEKELKHKIKGLTIDIYGNNNVVKLFLPISFEKTKIKIEGNYASFTMHSTTETMKNSYFYLSNYGHIFIDEESRFSRGTWVCINNNANNQPHKLHIGKYAQFGKDLLIRTSDGHSIFSNETNEPYNEPQDIIIGDHVWIGARCMLLKGTEIPSNCVIGAGSVVNKKFKESGCIIAGNPAKIVKKNIKWERISYGDFYNNKKVIHNCTPEHLSKQIILNKLKRKLKKLIF